MTGFRYGLGTTRLHSSIYALRLTDLLLGALGLSTTSLVQGQAVTINIIGASAGSTLTASGLPAGLTLNSAARTITGTSAGSGTSNITITETLAGKDNSPRVNSFTLTTTVEVTLNALTLSVSQISVGQSVSINIIGTTPNSGISGTVPAGLTINSSARTITGTATNAGTGGVSLTETLAGASNSPRTSTPPLERVAAPTTETVNAWTGHVTDDSATIVHRLDDDADARLVVSTASNLSSPVYSATVASASRTVKNTISGLAADTVYHYGLEVDGQLRTAYKGRFRTASSGAHSFRFGAAGCSQTPNSAVAAWLSSSASLDFFLHTGDIHYADIATNDVALFDAALDTALTSDQGALLRNNATAYTFDDHDYGANNSDSSSPSKAAALAAFRRRVPSPALWLTGANDPVGYSFVRGRVRFIVPDCRSAKTASTVFGSAQWTRIEQELAAAFSAQQVVALVISYPISGTEFPAAERTKLGNAIKTADMVNSVFVISGDAHSCAFDDGSNHDFATGGGAPLPVIIGNALDAASNSTKGGPYSGGTYSQSLEQASVIDITDAGGATITVDVDMVRDSGTVMGSHSISLAVPSVAPPAFNPQTLFASSENGMLFDIQDESTVYQDVGGTTIATVGGNVRLVRDISGNNNDLTLRSGTPPILRQTAEGLRYLDFNGSHGIIEAYFGELLNSFTRMFAYRLNSGSSLGRIISTSDYTNHKNHRIFQQTATQFTALHDADNVDFTTPGYGVDAVVTEIYEGTTRRFRTDDNAFAAGTQASETVPGFMLMLREAGDRTSNGRIYGLIAIDRTLSDQEQTEMRSWLLANRSA